MKRIIRWIIACVAVVISYVIIYVIYLGCLILSLGKQEKGLELLGRFDRWLYNMPD